MPLCASAGIMAGDSQNFFYHVKKGQTWKYCHSPLKKFIKWTKEQHPGLLKYRWIKMPHCIIIPSRLFHSHSHPLNSRMTIHLEDETSCLFLLEIISCGRKAHNECFRYSRFSSKVLLYRNDKLIYRDNTCYEPDRMPMEGIGMYEGYTHVANIFLTKLRDTAANLQLQEKIWQILDEASETEGGITRLTTGDMALRIFGQCAQKLQQTAEKIKKLYEHEQKQNMGAADYGSDSGI